jgi:predicted acyl esterase
MGANVWRSAPSLEKLGDKREVYYFTDDKEGDRYKLSRRRPAAPGFALQEIDYSNRNIFHNYHSYPYPIIQDKLDYITELMFVSEQLDRPRVISGAFVGELGITINKRDVDLGVTVFEQMPDGKLFHLGYWIGRASFAYDGSVRKLLTPGEKTRIPFETTLVSRQLSKGSRLLFLLDVNKNPTAQVNYGTGKDVSDESVVDAKEPLELRWHNDSYVRVPLER